MIEDQQRLSDGPPRKASLLNTVARVGIVLILILIAAWMVWAGRQPDLRSIWAPD